MKKNTPQRNTSRGYTLLFSVLVSSLVLAVGISILNIARKELLIATSTRDSSAALYAADSGLECAIYGESKGAFATKAEGISNLGCKTDPAPIFVEKPIFGPSVNDGTFVFHAKFGLEGTSCAVVTVIKTYVTETDRVRTTIKSRGYNTGWDKKNLTNQTDDRCDLTSARRVERALQYSSY